MCNFYKTVNKSFNVPYILVVPFYQVYVHLFEKLSHISFLSGWFVDFILHHAQQLMSYEDRASYMELFFIMTGKIILWPF